MCKCVSLSWLHERGEYFEVRKVRGNSPRFLCDFFVLGFHMMLGFAHEGEEGRVQMQSMVRGCSASRERSCAE